MFTTLLLSSRRPGAVGALGGRNLITRLAKSNTSSTCIIHDPPSPPQLIPTVSLGAQSHCQ